MIDIPPAPEELSADSGDRSAAIAGVSHRRAPRMRRGSAAEPGEMRYGRVMFPLEPSYFDIRVTEVVAFEQERLIQILG